MDFAGLFAALADVVRSIPSSGLLLTAIGALVGGWVGAILIRSRVRGGRLIRAGSTFVLAAILVTVVLQLSRFDPRIEMAVPELGLPEQVVEGGETRVGLARDGHFWLQGTVNGHPAAFLVDTGATLTAVSTPLARSAGLEPRQGGIPIRLNTANGSVAAHVTTIDSLNLGNVNASGLDAVIAPNIGTTNVLGMNFLSRLESWRVEGQTLILVPAASD